MVLPLRVALQLLRVGVNLPQIAVSRAVFTRTKLSFIGFAALRFLI
jgi:hypothetical protein